MKVTSNAHFGGVAVGNRTRRYSRDRKELTFQVDAGNVSDVTTRWIRAEFFDDKPTNYDFRSGISRIDANIM